MRFNDVLHGCMIRSVGNSTLTPVGDLVQSIGIPAQKTAPRSADRTGAQRTPPGGGLFVLLKPYRGLVALLVVLTIVGNGLTLVVPKLIARSIDAYPHRAFVLSTVVSQ